jgi:hypothetical protein
MPVCHPLDVIAETLSYRVGFLYPQWRLETSLLAAPVAVNHLRKRTVLPSALVAIGESRDGRA